MSRSIRFLLFFAAAQVADCARAVPDSVDMPGHRLIDEDWEKNKGPRINTDSRRILSGLCVSVVLL